MRICTTHSKSEKFAKSAFQSQNICGKSTEGAISSDLYRHYFCGNFLNFPFLFSFHMNLCCTWVAFDGKNCRQAWKLFLPILC